MPERVASARGEPLTATNPNPPPGADPTAEQATRRPFTPSAPTPAIESGNPARLLIEAYLEVRTMTSGGPAWIPVVRRRPPAPRRLVLLQLDQHVTTRLSTLRCRLHARMATQEESPGEDALLGRIDHALSAMPANRTRWWIFGLIVAVALVAHAGIAVLRAVTDPGTTGLGEVMSKANALVDSLTGSMLSLNFKQFSDAVTDASDERFTVLMFVAIILALSAWLVLRPWVWAYRAKRRVVREAGVADLERAVLGRTPREQPLDLALGIVPVLPFAYLGLFMGIGLLTGSLELRDGQSPAGAAVLAVLLVSGSLARLAVLSRHRARR
jgi:hypothetical protein